MADLIDRQAAIEWLKKVGRCWKCCEDTKLLRKMLGRIINHIEKMPVADAVEVVRCKDCKWHCPTYDGRIFCGAEKNINFVQSNHFCGYGEREEDNG